VKRNLTGYKTAQFMSRFVAGQISPEEPTFALSVGRGPTGFLGDPCRQKCSEFNYFI
jgi:hypothetical protein